MSLTLELEKKQILSFRMTYVEVFEVLLHSLNLLKMKKSKSFKLYLQDFVTIPQNNFHFLKTKVYRIIITISKTRNPIEKIDLKVPY